MKRTAFLSLILLCFALTTMAAPRLHENHLSVEASQIDQWIDSAATEFDVPADLLRSIAYVESRWNTHLTAQRPRLSPRSQPEDETAMPNSYGVMGLRDDDYFGHSLIDAAGLIGRTPEDLKSDPQLNIRGAAALLSLLGRGRAEAQTVESWEDAVARYSGIPQTEIAHVYSYDVFNSMREGRDSESYRVEGQPVNLEAIYGQERLRILAAPRVMMNASDHAGHIAASSSDYAPALWNPAASCNYTTGRTMAITNVVIHTTEGSYAGTISWFQNCSAQVSAHYVVRSSDGQITQMVYEKDKAWHVGSENGYTIGIEHEGYVSTPSWFTDAMYNQSALLVRDICASYGFDKTKVYDGSLGWNAVISNPAQYVVKGHVNYPNQTHQDPGSGWNWPKYKNLVTGTTGGSSQLLSNAGFESGYVNWVAASTGDITSSTSRSPHSGSWYAWLGGWSSTHTDWMYQTVTIPSTASTASLSFYLKVDTAETTTTTAYDTLKVQIRDASNALLTQLTSLSNLSASCCYTQKTFDISAYRGRTVRVYFEAYNDSAAQTSFVIDDAAVNVQ
jgi:N-acetyl-anhydromuramyl-L-alanine amidase AmpD